MGWLCLQYQIFLEKGTCENPYFYRDSENLPLLHLIPRPKLATLMACAASRQEFGEQGCSAPSLEHLSPKVAELQIPPFLTMGHAGWGWQEMAFNTDWRLQQDGEGCIRVSRQLLLHMHVCADHSHPNRNTTIRPKQHRPFWFMPAGRLEATHRQFQKQEEKRKGNNVPDISMSKAFYIC